MSQDNKPIFDKDEKIVGFIRPDGTTIIIGEDKKKIKDIIEINKLVQFKAVQINTSKPAIAQLEIIFPESLDPPSSFKEYLRKEVSSSNIEQIRLFKVRSKTYVIEIKSYEYMYSWFEKLAIKCNEKYNFKIITKSCFTKWEWSFLTFGINKENIIIPVKYNKRLQANKDKLKQSITIGNLQEYIELLNISNLEIKPKLYVKLGELYFKSNDNVNALKYFQISINNLNKEDRVYNIVQKYIERIK